MKLVILGNGFDLASGLPTRYNDFFQYNNEKYKVNLEKIDEFLNLIRSSELDFDYMTYEEIYTNIEKDIKKHLIHDSKFIDMIARRTKLSIWSLYFWYMNETLEIDNWSDVETQIAEIIRDKYNLTSIDRNLSINETDIIMENYIRNLIEDTAKVSHLYSSNIYGRFEKEDRFRYICDYIILKRYLGKYDINYTGILKKELENFEEDFKEYIGYITEKIIKKNKFGYRINLLLVGDEKSAENKTDDRIFLLNFNYTEFSRKDETDRYHIVLSYSGRDIDVTQVNVHGTHHSKILFGIDQSDRIKKEFYQFTKTYRKIEASESIPNIQLPSPNDIDEIIIYGHSLSKADYSYFHSIFDYYNIYGSNIKLKFKYSTHGEPYICKSNHVKKMMELIKIYGDKMTDTARGDNLVHKLLLENRLSIEEVVLNQLKYNVPDNNPNN